MKCKTMRHEIIEFQWMALLLLFTICFSSCKDDKDASAVAHDPNQPIEVTDFTPKSGGEEIHEWRYMELILERILLLFP